MTKTLIKIKMNTKYTNKFLNINKNNTMMMQKKLC